jgi:hypothetical protein
VSPGPYRAGAPKPDEPKGFKLGEAWLEKSDVRLLTRWLVCGFVRWNGARHFVVALGRFALWFLVTPAVPRKV